MQSSNSFKTNIFHINNQNFDNHALELFNYQFDNNKTYRDYVKHLNVRPEEVSEVSEIPFLPIQFFKKYKIMTGSFRAQHVFESSGTTGARSRHYVDDLDFYKNVSHKIFESFFGDLKGAAVIGLLPSYLERGNSSLVYMVDHFVNESGNKHSGFYLDNQEMLLEKLKNLSNQKSPVFLFGVTFALLELANRYQFDFENLYILETGGMKGRGKELIREELHSKLKKAFNTSNIYSEYGMTELLSQAYLQNDGFFHTPPWMKILVRQIHDPFDGAGNGQVGILKIIDLANVHSCAFIETEDLGLVDTNKFKVVGRLDNTDLRGCNLLLS